MAIPHFWRVMGQQSKPMVTYLWAMNIHTTVTSAFAVTTRAFLGVMIRATWGPVCAYIIFKADLLAMIKCSTLW